MRLTLERIRPWLGVIVLIAGLAGIARLAFNAGEGNWRRCENQNPALSIPGCTMLIELDRETPENMAIAYYNRAIAYREREDHTQALADVTESIRIDPGRGDSYYLRGRIHAARHDYRLAIADYDRAIALEPHLVSAVHFRGLARRMTGDIAGGDTDIARARELSEKTR